MNLKCVLSLQRLSDTVLIPKIIERDMMERFLKYDQISNLMKIRPVGVELFHPDGQTHMTKLKGSFRNFAEQQLQSHLLTKILSHLCAPPILPSYFSNVHFNNTHFHIYFITQEVFIY